MCSKISREQIVPFKLNQHDIIQLTENMDVQEIMFFVFFCFASFQYTFCLFQHATDYNIVHSDGTVVELIDCIQTFGKICYLMQVSGLYVLIKNTWLFEIV